MSGAYLLSLVQSGSNVGHRVSLGKGCKVTLSQVSRSKVNVIAELCEKSLNDEDAKLILLDYLENRYKFQTGGGDNHPSDGEVCYRGMKKDAFGGVILRNCF